MTNETSWLDEGVNHVDTSGVSVLQGGAAPPTELSNYCVKLDSWGKRRVYEEFSRMHNLPLLPERGSHRG